MNFRVNTKSSRYLKSKYHKTLSSNTTKNSLIFVGFTSFVAAILLIVLNIWFGWIILIVPTIMLMVHEWWRHSLQEIKPINGANNPEDLLDPDTLAAIKKKDPSQEELIEYLTKTNGLWFMANRFGLHPEILKTVTLSDNWWQKAVELWQEHPNKSGVDAAHIIVAIIKTSPDIDVILSHTRNKPEDLDSALNWYSYANELLESLNKRRQSGGIARDWAAGYTPLLDTFAINISRSIQYGSVAHREVIGHTNVINQMLSVFTSAGRANIALVGEAGSGRSTCIQAFAESLLFDVSSTQVKYSQVYQIDMSSLLTKVKPDQLGAVIQNMANEAYRAKNIVLYLDNAGAFFGDDNQPDITEAILPIIEGGRVRMVLSLTPRHWQYLQGKKPQVVAALNYQVVQPTNAQDTIKILENQCLFTEGQYKCLFTYESIKEIYRLAERYGPEIAMPGRAISVLEDVARNNQNGLVQKGNVQKTLEQTTGIKIASADTEEKDVLQNLESSIRARVIGQDTAVREIASALKRSRAGVSNPNRPIGTFLFLGPTGVGKTEMSKTLANVYFGGDAGMVRVDMNEYITQDSVHNLLSGNTEYGTAFLETIRRKPFSVVLFDEIEKAHPDVVNTLLQMLDEGVMKDADNRTVSFKDAIIIATSNAGADIIREKISNGVSVKELEQHLTDDLIAKGAFKPEFINRFDDVIIFSPLTVNELGQVVQVMLGDINKSLSEQGVQVALSADAVQWLVSQGYDERLGARPLRRMMQKTVETAVSDILLAGQAQHGTTITLNSEILAKALGK